MHWRRFSFLVILGFALTIFSFACTNLNREATQTPQTPTTQQTDKPQISSLPPQTQEIVKSAGANDLFYPPRGDVRLVAISDLNSAYGSTDYDPEVDKAINLLPFWQPDMVVCSGDMIAGQKKSLTEAQIKAMWAAFDNHIAAPLRQANIPFGFTIGNHDASGAKKEGNFVFEQERDLASEYWNNPEHDPGIEFIDKSQFPFFYTFKHKDIFFMAWDGSTHRIPPDKLAWVEKALASPQAQQAKMRILLSHLPLYAVAEGRNKFGAVMANADELRQMLEKYNVHTYISGHQHAYYPGHRGKLQLLHMGLIGSGPRALIGTQVPSAKAITVVDINFNSPELTTYTTYDMKTLELIEYKQLPRFLTGHNGIVLRRDVEYKDLKAEEKAACVDKIGEQFCQNQ
ncbi:MAG: metallophosphoesterase [Rivularia sp. (in: Bacteria)]|nr:metallophosphoesterase [Rivularia sp. MS3]